LFDALEHHVSQNIRTNGEFQLTDALQYMVDQGIKISATTVNNWFDCGRREILLRTNTMLLKSKGYASDKLPEFHNTIINHPVCIGANCSISNSIIGPYVSIGENSTIKSSIVSDSIVGSFTSLEQAVLHQSIIGSDTSIKGPRQSLNIGDNTEIDFTV
jgi:glucose-1-phosphate thymidylyltransferase